MSGLIKLLVEEIEDLIKKRQIIYNEWRLTKEEEPDPTKYPTIIVYDYYLKYNPSKYIAMDGRWVGVCPDKLRVGDIGELWCEFWKPYIQDDDFPPKTLIERFEKLYKEN